MGRQHMFVLVADHTRLIIGDEDAHGLRSPRPALLCSPDYDVPGTWRRCFESRAVSQSYLRCLYIPGGWNWAKLLCTWLDVFGWTVLADVMNSSGVSGDILLQGPQPAKAASGLQRSFGLVALVCTTH